MRKLNITEEIIQSIIDLYNNGMVLLDIAKKFSLSYGFIHSLINKNKKITKRKIKYALRDENFFKKIDSEWKSYLLGLFFSDGCVKTNRTCEICLHENDKYLLYELNNLIFKSGINVHKINKKSAYLLKINNTTIVNDLQLLGCVKRKSLILQFPTYDTIPKNVFNHFLRGYFDGDGYISLTRNTFQISSSNSFCDELQKFLNSELGIKSHIIKKKNHSDIQVYNKNNLKIIYDYLYNNSEFYIKRKRNIFEKILINFNS
jgi:hypothetical protein